MTSPIQCVSAGCGRAHWHGRQARQRLLSSLSCNQLVSCLCLLGQLQRLPLLITSGALICFARHDTSSHDIPSRPKAHSCVLICAESWEIPTRCTGCSQSSLDTSTFSVSMDQALASTFGAILQSTCACDVLCCRRSRPTARGPIAVMHCRIFVVTCSCQDVRCGCFQLWCAMFAGSLWSAMTSLFCSAVC